jgi:cell division initiation protein
MIVDEAKKNANRIVNEALLKAEKIETNTLALQRNANIFKRRLKQIIEEQLEMVNDLEKVEF